MVSEGPGRSEQEADRVAWHAGKWEGFVSTVSHGRLFESRDGRLGDAYKGRFPGVYSHSHSSKHKVFFYMRLAPLGHGLMWGYLWETRVDHADRVFNGNKDKSLQWAHKGRGVDLVARWVCGIGIDFIHKVYDVAFAWNPALQSYLDDDIWAWRENWRALAMVCGVMGAK